MAGVSTEVKRLEEYIDQSDWRVKANANQGYSVGGAILNVAGGAAAGFWFKQYGDEIANLHKDGDFYIHDLDYVSGYCCGHSLRSLLLEGFNGVEGKISSNPPKHLSSALNQMVNFLGTLQNEWAGAQAFSSVDTLLAPYVWIEREDIRKEFKDLGVDVDKDEIKAKIEETLKKRVHQQIQELIFNLSVSSRWGNQTVFSNFSFDIRPPKDLADKNPIVGGEPMDMVYADFQKEMDLLNITFCNVMYEGDRDGRIFSFPIPTYSMTKDFPYYSEVGDAIFRLTAKYGSPYFANYTNTTMSPEDARSMCCRLRLDLRELKKRGGGLFGSSEQTGSIGVVTLNMARIGALYKTEEEVFKRIDYLMEMAKTSLLIKRRVITDLLERGFYPYTKRYLGSFNNFFNTIGVNGVNEMIENMTDKKENITTDFGREFAEKILTHINDRLLKYQQESGSLWNLEATPAEGCFAGDTEVVTTEGVKRIDEIAGRTDVGVLSFNEKTHKREFKTPVWVRQTGIKRVLKVKFDNGQEVICTGNHPFGVRSWDGKRGEYVKYVSAQDLTPGMRIKSAYKEMHGGFDGKRQYITYGRHDYLHRMMWEYAHNTEIPNGYVVHHKDFVRTNNSFDNLELMKSSEHKKLHLNERHKTGDETIRVKCGEANVFYGKTHTNETKRKISETRKGKCAGDENFMRAEEGRKLMSEIAKNKPANKHSKFNQNIDEQKIFNLFMAGKNAYQIAKELGGVYTYSICKSRLRLAGMLQSNHVVKSVEWLDYEIPVYNMEIPENHNYFVGGDKGVLVHNCTYKLAMSDKKKYGSEYVYYTNSTQLPTGYTDDPFLAIKMQENLQSLYTGGTVLHLYLSKALGNTDEQSRDLTRELVKRSISQSKLPYVSITPVFSVCPEHGYIYGEHAVCPKCGKKTEVWSRVMGYFRPRDSYNIGKRYEHDHKKLFDAELIEKELKTEENLEPFTCADGVSLRHVA